jgi:hypothetical protein
MRKALKMHRKNPFATSGSRFRGRWLLVITESHVVSVTVYICLWIC